MSTHLLPRRTFLCSTAAALGALLPRRAAAAPSADEIIGRILEQDPWGLSGADVSARVLIKGGGKTRELSFRARSRRYAPRLAKSLVRFTAPADVSGTGFLQIQKADGDDERHLYLPELKKARRIAGASRKSSFMGTDFSYGDLDRRDLRDAKAKVLATEKLGSHDAYKLEAIPTGADPLYARMEVWARAEDLVPMKWHFYAASGAHVKTLVAKGIKKVEGRLFIVESTMSSLADGRTTDLVLEKVVPLDTAPDDEFTVRSLEKT